MAKRKSTTLGGALWGLPLIVKLIIAVFFEFVFGICRFIDGLLKGDVLKAVIGFIWIFYGCIFGWIYDIICVLIKRRPWLL